MKRTLSVLGASLLFCLATAGTAAADGFGTVLSQTQTSGQSQSGSNSVTQDATSGALSVTGAQLNLNAPTSILSSGGGSVSQSNDSSATSSASNESTAVQVIDQGQQSSQTQNGQQTLGCGCDGGQGGALVEQDQASSQSQKGTNSVDQDASSKAISVTGAQVNVNAPISLLSHGGGGSVSQSNDASATSSASNKSTAKQGIEQEQSSRQAQDGRQSQACGCEQGGGGGHADPQQSQTSTQSQNGSNSVDQDARSKAISVTGAQLNVNAPISVLSHGGGGSVSQSNDSSATSSASNESTAIQWIDQSQSSSQTQRGDQQLGCCRHGGTHHGTHHGCGCHHHHSWWDKGKGPHCGCGHDEGPLLEQDQSSKQRQSGSNAVSQDAESKAISVTGAQLNVNAPKGKKKGGDVRQTNTSTADSSASNESWAVQRIGQRQASQQGQWGLQRL